MGCLTFFAPRGGRYWWGAVELGASASMWMLVRFPLECPGVALHRGGVCGGPGLLPIGGRLVEAWVPFGGAGLFEDALGHACSGGLLLSDAVVVPVAKPYEVVVVLWVYVVGFVARFVAASVSSCGFALSACAVAAVAAHFGPALREGVCAP